MAFILRLDQEVPISVIFTDDQGYPTTVIETPVWASSDETMLSVVAADDGMSAVVTPVGPMGLASIYITVDDHFLNLLLIEVQEIVAFEETEAVEAEIKDGTLTALVTAGPARMQPIP